MACPEYHPFYKLSTQEVCGDYICNPRGYRLVQSFLHSPSIPAVGAKCHGRRECSWSWTEHSFIYSIFHSFLPPFQRLVLNTTDGENVHGHGQNIHSFIQSFIHSSLCPAVGAKHHGRRECSWSRTEHSFIYSIFHSFLPPFQRSVLNPRTERMFMVTDRTFIHSLNLSFIPPSVLAVGAKRHWRVNVYGHGQNILVFNIRRPRNPM